MTAPNKNHLIKQLFLRVCVISPKSIGFITRIAPRITYINRIFLLALPLFVVACSNEAEQENQSKAEENGLLQFRDETTNTNTPAGNRLANVDGFTLTQDHLEAYRNNNSLSLQSLDIEATVDRLIDLKLLADEAKKQGLDKRLDLSSKIDIFEIQTLSRAYLKAYLDNLNLTEKNIEDEYIRLKEKTAKKEYFIRHILINSQATAQTLKTRVAAGEDFAEVAKSYYESQGSQASKDEGLIGWVVPSEMIPPIRTALAKLNSGEVSEVLSSDAGYHLVFLEQTRDTQFASFDDAKSNLRGWILTKKMEELIASLRQKAKVEK